MVVGHNSSLAFFQPFLRQHGSNCFAGTDEEVAVLSYEDKSNWLKRDPVTAGRHFQYRLNTFFQEFLKSSAKPLGEIVDFGIRIIIEFQARALHSPLCDLGERCPQIWCK